MTDGIGRDLGRKTTFEFGLPSIHVTAHHRWCGLGGVDLISNGYIFVLRIVPLNSFEISTFKTTSSESRIPLPQESERSLN